MEKRQMKATKRQDTKATKSTSPRPDGVDPDIADIVPGPQPHPFLEDDELVELDAPEEQKEQS